MTPLTPEQIESLVTTALSGPAIERPSALFNLIKAVSDPSGNKERYEWALEAMRVIDPQTVEYDAWFQARVAGPVQVGPPARVSV